MISCSESARLISEGLDRELPLWRRLGLRLHLAMCARCRTYRRQVEALDRLISRRYRRTGVGEDVGAGTLSEGARHRIKAVLRRKTR